MEESIEGKHSKNKAESHTVLAQLLQCAFEAEMQIPSPYAGNLLSVDSYS